MGMNGFQAWDAYKSKPEIMILSAIKETKQIEVYRRLQTKTNVWETVPQREKERIPIFLLSLRDNLQWFWKPVQAKNDNKVLYLTVSNMN